MQVMADNLVRMRELAEQSGSGTLNNDQRSALQTEFKNLQDEIDRIVATTKFNGITVLSASGSVDFQVGVDSGINNVISLKTEDRHGSSLGVGSSQVAVSMQAVAQDAIKSIDSAIRSLAQTRGTFGALENRLQTTIANI
jgi:flagellin